MDNKTINGPINVIRMEGIVNDVKKVVYIFGDIHKHVNYQTKCPDEISLDVSQYFASCFSKPDKIIDFMFEITQDYIKRDLNGKTQYKMRYIENLMDLYINNNKNKKDVNTNNNDKPYIRYHYMDIRDILESENIKNIDNDLFNIVTSMLGYVFIYESTFSHIINQLSKLINEITILKNRLLDKNDKIINKIKYGYKNKDIQNKINFFWDYLDVQIDSVISDCLDLKLYIKNFKAKLSFEENKLIYKKFTNVYTYGGQDNLDIIHFTSELYTKYYIITTKIIDIFVNMTDIYFLRRLLDKSYIKNTIVYTGIAHSIRYIQILLTQFDFKITHCSYSKVSDIKKVNSELKKYINLDENIEFQRMFYPPYLIQCSNISTFPKNFD